MVKGNRDRMKNVLAVRTDRMGEMLLTLPAVRTLRDNFPDSRISLMLSPSLKDLVINEPYIDILLPYSEGRHRGFWGTIKLARLLKSGGFDLIVIFNPAKKFNLASFLAGIPCRLGYNRKCGFLLNYRIEDRKYQGEKHEIEYNIDLLRPLGLEPGGTGLSLSIDKESLNRIDGLFVRENIGNNTLLAVHPWASNPGKEWGEDNFAALIKILAQQGERIAVIGGSENIERASSLIQKSGSRVLDLTGKLSLKELSALLSKCRLLVSNDSGPVHVAAAAGTRVIALFRKNPPAVSARRWGPWGRGHAVIEKDALSDISVEEVLDKIKEFI